MLNLLVTRGKADRLKPSTVREYTVWYNDPAAPPCLRVVSVRACNARLSVRAECTPSSRQAERMTKRRAKSVPGLETETAENSFHPTYFSNLGEGEGRTWREKEGRKNV